MRHQYGISALVSQKLFREETGGGVAECWQFSLARGIIAVLLLFSY